ncbi:MAG: N-acetylmuramoyl-L-alanine amidase [Synechococcaceae cyanobacterium]
MLALQHLLNGPTAAFSDADQAEADPRIAPPPATEAALRQLVLLPEFAAFVTSPDPLQPGPPGSHPRRQALIERCRHTFAQELVPSLMAFSDRCRAALASPTSAQAADSLSATDLSYITGLALALPLFFAIGWLGHHFLNRQSEERTAEPSALEALQHTPQAKVGPQSLPSGQPQAIGAHNLKIPAAAPAYGSASLACLRGRQGESPAPASPSNYDRRERVNWRGQPVPSHPQLIVLHETVVDEGDALALFQRRNREDAQQASYHMLIGRDGRRIRVVNDNQRAFGAGDSAFHGLTVQLRPTVPASVNNIALHVSLVSPADGADGEAARHSGYTPEQYRSLATQIALWQTLYGIPGANVVTHQEVDRSGSRRDPRSFDWRSLGVHLRQQLVACSGGAPTP